MGREEMAQSIEPGSTREDLTQIADRPRDILQIPYVPHDRRLVAERPQGLEVPLNRHAVESLEVASVIGDGLEPTRLWYSSSISSTSEGERVT